MINRRSNKNGARVGRKRKGFTLMELLVVVGILGLLMALITTAMIRGQVQARSVECLNNLRQHGVALANFVAEHSEYPLGLTVGLEAGTVPEHGKSVFAALGSHGLGPQPGPELPRTQKSVYHCPAAAHQTIPAELRAQGTEPGSFYGYNVDGLGGWKNGPLGLGASGTSAPVKESQVVNPSRLIAMGDGVRGWGAIYEDCRWILGRTREAQEFYGSTARVRQLHTKRLNLLWCDGHVEGVGLDFLFAVPTDAALAVWNRDQQPHRERLE